MPIDWFTVIAQVINFLVLVWLLKRFLYKPILDAIDERDKGVARQVADADAKRVAAEREREDFEHKNTQFDQDRTALLKQATDDANLERHRLFDEARKDADTIRVKRREALRAEQIQLNEEIVRRTHQQVIATVRKMLTDLATTSLEDQMSVVFLQRLHALTQQEKERLVAASKKSRGSIRIRSAFELSPTQQSEIERAIKEAISVDAQFQFETVSELVSGIELVADGTKVAWSIRDYLASLEKSFDDLVVPCVQVESENESEQEPASVNSTEKVNH